MRIEQLACKNRRFRTQPRSSKKSCLSPQIRNDSIAKRNVTLQIAVPEHGDDTMTPLPRSVFPGKRISAIDVSLGNSISDCTRIRLLPCPDSLLGLHNHSSGRSSPSTATANSRFPGKHDFGRKSFPGKHFLGGIQVTKPPYPTSRSRYESALRIDFRALPILERLIPLTYTQGLVYMRLP